MVRTTLFLLLVWGGVTLQGADRMRVQGRGYAFLVTEPAGWRINLNAAHQIARFVMHPAQTSWREAAVLAFGRVVPQRPGETLEAFAQSDLEGYQQSCPFYEAGEADLEIKKNERFLSRSLSCPGLRHEIVTFTQGAGFFATFVLTADTPAELQKGVGPFQEMLNSFAWAAPP